MDENAEITADELPDVVNPDGPILCFGMVRNEADIIEATIRHNLAYIDEFHLIDDGSSDGTFEILEALAAETGRVKVRRRDELGYRKAEILRKSVSQQGKKLNAAHIVLLDADEALLGDPEAFRHYLRHSKQPLSLHWVSYVPTGNDRPHANPLVRITQRRSEERPQHVKKTVPHGLIGKVWFDNGFHSMRTKGRSLATDTSHGFAIAHFPVRSGDQIAAKVLIGVWNYRLDPKRIPSNGTHWEKMAEYVMKNGRPDPVTTQEFAQGYAAHQTTDLVSDPLAGAGQIELKYTRLAKNGLLQKLIAFTERLVAEQEANRG